MIEINESVQVSASPDEVWAVLSDPYQVVDCIADAVIEKQNDDGTYDGKITVKFGPMRVTFSAVVALAMDEQARQGTITARGRDAQGGTRMKTTATFDLIGDVEKTGASVVNVRGSLDLSGRLADQIEAAAGTVVKRMSGEFVEALALRFPDNSADSGPGVQGQVRLERTFSRGWLDRVIGAIIRTVRRLL